MSYYVLPNLGELKQGNSISKLRTDVSSKDFIDRECNWNLSTKVNVMCAYRGECLRCCDLYKVTLKCCGEFYVGNKPNKLENIGTTFPICGPKIYEW